MKRRSPAFRKFLEDREEVRVLIDHALSFSPAEAIQKANLINGITRGATVLLSSYIEAYFRYAFFLIIARIVDDEIELQKFHGQLITHLYWQQIKSLQESTTLDAISNNLIGVLNQCKPMSEGVYDEVNLETALSNLFHNIPSPRTKNMQKVFIRFGLNLNHAMNVKFHGQTQLKKQQFDNVVATRNDIAHGNTAMQRSAVDLRSDLHTVYEVLSCLDNYLCTQMTKRGSFLRVFQFENRGIDIPLLN